MQYINSLKQAIFNDFPDDVIEFILHRINSFSNQFDINILWISFISDRSYLNSPGNVNHIQKLLSLRANIDYQDPETGSTPIMYLAQNGKKDSVSLLIERGADLTIKNKNNRDVYYYAEEGRVDLKSIIDNLNEKKTKQELVNRNQMLERQCNDMNDKLNYLLNVFGKMNIAEPIDMLHKKNKFSNEM